MRDDGHKCSICCLLGLEVDLGLNDELVDLGNENGIRLDKLD